MKFRTIVTAYRRTDRSKSAERCVYLEAASPQEAEETSKTVLKLIYAECDAFEAFNTLSKQEEPDAVLRFVIGGGQGQIAQTAATKATAEAIRLNQAMRRLAAIVFSIRLAPSSVSS